VVLAATVVRNREGIQLRKCTAKNKPEAIEYAKARPLGNSKPLHTPMRRTMRVAKASLQNVIAKGSAGVNLIKIAALEIAKMPTGSSQSINLKILIYTNQYCLMKFPEVELQAHTGEVILPARTPKAVVYFFPKAFTQGCTRETIRFNELYEQFKQRGYEVYGVSTDSVETLRKFADRYGVKFKLLSDKGGKLASQLGILRPTGTAERVTYILKEGEVVHVLRGLKSADEHADRALELAQ